MGQSRFMSADDFDEYDASTSRGGTPRMERTQRQKSSRRLKVRTASRPNNAATKRGIHRRRNKHMNW